MDLDQISISKMIFKLKSGSLPLKVESGRHLNIPRENRICEICNTGQIEDKFHFCFDCPALKEERQQLLDILVKNKVGVIDSIVSHNNEWLVNDKQQLFNLIIGSPFQFTNPSELYSAIYILWKKRCSLLNCSPGVNALIARQSASPSHIYNRETPSFSSLFMFSTS